MNGAMRVLVVDDEETFRFVMENRLKASGHYVECAPSGEVALERIGEKAFDVRSLEAVIKSDGAEAQPSVERLGNEIRKGESKLIARVTGVWRLGTTSWSLEATVADQKGDRYRAQYWWEPPSPPR